MAKRTVWALSLLFLIIAEGLFLGICFDSDSLRQLPHGWWTGPLGYSGKAMPVAMMLATGFMLLAVPKLQHETADQDQSDPRLAGELGSDERSRVARRSSPASSPLRALIWLGAHLLTFALLYCLSRQLFGVADAVRRRPGPWVAAWLAAAAATAATWLATLCPLAELARIFNRFRWLALGCILVGLLAFFAGLYTQQWWNALRSSTLLSSYAVLHGVDSSAWVDVANMRIGAGTTFKVEVNRQCSGYEGIGLTWVFLLGFFAVFRRDLRFPRVLLLLPAATAAVWAANVLRIAALVWLGAHGWPDIAFGGFHSFAGVLLFSAVALAGGAVAHRSRFFSRNPPASDIPGPNPVAPFIVPFLITIATLLIAGLFSTGSGIDRLYGLRVLAGGLALLIYCKRYGRFNFHISNASLVIAASIALLWIGSSWLIPRPAPGPDALPSAWRLIWLVSRCAGAIITAPIVEELAFRGYLARRLMSADFDRVPLQTLTWPAILISSLAFAVLHPWQQMLAAFLAGLGYAFLARRRGRLSEAIVAHALTNFLLTVYVLRWHAWGVWG